MNSANVSTFVNAAGNVLMVKVSRFALVLGLALVGLTSPAVSFAQEAGPGEGLVVFSRDDKFAGKAIRFNVTISGAPGFQLPAGSEVRRALPAGTYTFSVHTPSLDGQDYLTIDVQEGWTYYVEGTVLMGWPAGRAKFNLVSESGPAAGSGAKSRGDHVALAGPALGAATASAASAPARSAEESGRIGLRNFVGDWDLQMWSLSGDGNKLEGRGVAQGVAEGNSTRITITEFSAPAFPAATGGGQVRIGYEEGKGFTLESWFKHTNEVLNFSGRYEADTGRYVFYLFGSSGEFAAGVQRSSVRVEIRSEDIATWVADTYSAVDGQSLLVQSYRFTRRSN
jgi:hypothetical protein